MAAGDINDMKKSAEAYAKALSASEKSVSDMQKTFAEINAALFELSVNDFFKEIERSPEIMMKLEAEAKKLTDELKNSGNEINKIFSGAFKNTQKSTALDKLELQTRKLKVDFPQAAALMEKELATIRANGALTIKDLDFASILAKSPQEAAEFSKALLGAKVSAGKLDDEINNTVLNSLKLSEVEKDLAKTTKEVFSVSQGLDKFIERNFALRTIVKDILKYDEDISKAQRETGILFKDNTIQMSKLAIETARFGLSTSDVAGFMGDIGDTLNTTNFELLSKAARDTEALSMATGAAYGDITKLTAQFMSLGGSSEDAAGYIHDASSDAKAMSLSSAKIIKDINTNFTKFRSMGFVGGEKSLEKMAIQAQKLRINIDDIFNVADKARSIEGAMEMAADLQLAGGMAANFDPMQLLAAARNDPKELAKILSQMTSDIGKFNKETGEVEFDPVDKERMEMIAKATNTSMNSLISSTTKAKQRMQKEASGMFDGFQNQKVGDIPVSDILEQMSTIGKGGVIQFSGAFKDIKSVQELKDLGQKEIQSRIEAYNHTQETDEAAAARNMDFNKSLTALKNSLMNVFTLFEPLIKILTGVLNSLNSLPEGWKIALVASIAAMRIAWKGMGGIGGGGAGGGIMGKIGGMFGGGKSPAATAGDLAKEAAPAGDVKSGATIEQNLTGIANGIKSFASPQVVLGALAMIPAAIGLTMMTATLPFLLGIALIGEAAGIGLSAFGEGMAVFGEAISAAAPEIVIGELVLAGFGLALIPLMYSLSLLSPLVDSFGKIIIGVFSAIPPIISAVAEGIVTVSDGFMDMATSLIPLAPGLYMLAPALVAAALGFSALFFSFANPIAMIGMGLMIMTLSSLNNIMTTLTPSLQLGATGINSMADGVKNLSTALSTINTDTLDSLKHFAESMTVASAINNLTGVVGNLSGNGTKGGEVQKFEFTVIVKNESGREIQRKIIKDTDLMT